MKNIRTEKYNLTDTSTTEHIRTARLCGRTGSLYRLAAGLQGLAGRNKNETRQKYKISLSLNAFIFKLEKTIYMAIIFKHLLDFLKITRIFVKILQNQ